MGTPSNMLEEGSILQSSLVLSVNMSILRMVVGGVSRVSGALSHFTNRLMGDRQNTVGTGKPTIQSLIFVVPKTIPVGVYQKDLRTRARVIKTRISAQGFFSTIVNPQTSHAVKYGGVGEECCDFQSVEKCKDGHGEITFKEEQRRITPLRVGEQT